MAGLLSFAIGPGGATREGFTMAERGAELDVGVKGRESGSDG